MRQGKGTELWLECSSTFFGGCFIGSAVRHSVKSITELFKFEQSTNTHPQQRHAHLSLQNTQYFDFLSCLKDTP